MSSCHLFSLTALEPTDVTYRQKVSHLEGGWGDKLLPLWPASSSHCWTVVRESVCRIWQSSSNTFREGRSTSGTDNIRPGCYRGDGDAGELKFSDRELLVVKGLRVSVELGPGSALGRLAGWRDEPPCCSWILSLPTLKFSLRLFLKYKPDIFIFFNLISNIRQGKEI